MADILVPVPVTHGNGRLGNDRREKGKEVQNIPDLIPVIFN